MAKLKLFEYAVILHEKKENSGKEEYVGAKIIISPTIILAKDEKEVGFKATREIKEEHAQNPDNVEIIIRNF